MVPLGVKEEDFPQPGWRVAFESAFGMTVDEFYDLYEDHRSAGFPEVAITKWTQDLSPRPASGHP